MAKYYDKDGNVTGNGALVACMFMTIIYLSLACFALASDRMKVSREPIPSCLTTVEDGAAMPAKLKAAEGK